MKNKITCPNCSYSFAVKAKRTFWFSQIKCSKCNAVFPMDGNQRTPFFKKFKDLVAQGYDKKTGQPFWLDKKGKRVRHDDSSIRYNVINDPRGWRVTGTKVKYKGYGDEGRW